MKKNILLINPWIHDFAAYDFWIKPYGLLFLAALMRENGYEVRLINCLDPYHPEMTNEKHLKVPKRGKWGNGHFYKEAIYKPEALRAFPRYYHRYGITPRIFCRTLKGMRQPDLIMLTSMMTYWYPGVFEAIHYIRQVFPSAPIILGGNYATLCREHAVRLSGADYVLSGKAENWIQKIVSEILGDEIQFMPNREVLDSRPYPAFDLLTRLDQVPVITSEGCPYHCSYCASAILNDRFRTRDPIRVVDEIAFWHNRFGVTNFSFYDDALLVHSGERAIPMLQEIIRRNIGCAFHCPNGLHLREITEKTSELMYKAGFRTIRFGFETADVKRQIETGGKVNNQEFAKAVRLLRKAGYKGNEIGVYIMCGLPGQSFDEVYESIRLVQSYGVKAIITEFSPIPGTPLWNECVDASPYDIVHEPLYHNNTLLPCRAEEFTLEMYRELKLLTRKALN